MMGECGIAVSGSLRSIKPLRTIKSYPFEQVDTSVPQCMPAKDATRLKRFVTPPGWVWALSGTRIRQSQRLTTVFAGPIHPLIGSLFRRKRKPRKWPNGYQRKENYAIVERDAEREGCKAARTNPKRFS